MKINIKMWRLNVELLYWKTIAAVTGRMARVTDRMLQSSCYQKGNHYEDKA